MQRTIEADGVGKSKMIARLSRKGQRVRVSYTDQRGCEAAFTRTFRTRNALAALDETEKAFRQFVKSPIAKQMGLSATTGE